MPCATHLITLGYWAAGAVVGLLAAGWLAWAAGRASRGRRAVIADAEPGDAATDGA